MNALTETVLGDITAVPIKVESHYLNAQLPVVYINMQGVSVAY